MVKPAAITALMDKN